MAPIATTALMDRLLASAHNTASASMSTRTLTILPSLATSPPLTPALAFQHIARVLLSKRDDDDDPVAPTAPDKHLNIIFPAVVGIIFLCAVYGCTADHFRKGGTYTDYFKAWRKSIFLLLLVTVLLPITILGGLINCHRARKNKRLGITNPTMRRRGQPGFQARPLQPTNNPHAGREPPPPNRPQMPLDAVVVMPDIPDQEDPDAVDYVAPLAMDLVQPPPPVLQKAESTAEATDVFLSDSKTGP